MQKRKTVTVRMAISLGIGSMVGAGIFALMGEAAALAGSAVWFSFLLAGIIALLTGHSFVELGVRYPTRGGIVEYLVRAYGVGIVLAKVRHCANTGLVLGTETFREQVCRLRS